jgi:hypothetical protein
MQYINTVPVLFNHPLNASDLTGNSFGSTEQFFPQLAIHAYTYTQYRYMQATPAILDYFSTGAVAWVDLLITAGR